MPKFLVQWYKGEQFHKREIQAFSAKALKDWLEQDLEVKVISVEEVNAKV